MTMLYRNHYASLPLVPTFQTAAGLGATTTATIQRAADQLYWDHAGAAWVAVPPAPIPNNPMTEYNAANLPGHYALGAAPISTNGVLPQAILTAGDVLTINYTESGSGEVSMETIQIVDSPAASVWDALETAHVTAGSFGELMKVIAGLGFRYFRQFSHAYDPVSGQLTSAKIRVYATQGDANADVNHLVELDWATSYTASNQPNVSRSW